MRKVIPFLKSEYFSDSNEQLIFTVIKKFIEQYNNLPSREALVIALQNNKTLNDDQYQNALDLINSFNTKILDDVWLLDETEKFCKDKELYNAILTSISIMDGREKNLSTDGIPSILQKALGVCFDDKVGHDYIENADSRFDFYNLIESRIPFDLDYFNKITNGGLPNKTLNVVLAGTGTGKTLFMCHVASSVLSLGKNVLYITLEMAEERIAERIDANLMNIAIDQIKNLPKNIFNNRISKIREKTNGKLIIKEYPTASAHVGHFSALINELMLKKQFKPDLIIVDYLNICISSRFKAGANINSYTLVKAIAEELRGMAVENNVPILSATQTTRGGFSNTDVELTDTSESFGLPSTVDLMFALISTEELEQLNQLLVKQLKNRYNDPTVNKRFVIGVDRSKMKLYNLEQSAQKGLSDSGITLKDEDLDNMNVNDIFKKTKRDFSNIKV
jgi:archaellum biogenesis ATPase FlaH